ncbi:helix-turn-helix transcriptional regulator [Altererythrobacter aerius]|uniref:Helix-turn-helix transcriptional regulator n=1 Tax=Tsuneonella aeria TaxID=1837929 RepID=A0A6I4TC80_9SPHN|nr:LuxR C-terminal-related transcriptional regulator [Tsuneonella aeria]MXO74257.1 helix-turn-helix transcriptional regulator [Tsuneonella aeria]
MKLKQLVHYVEPDTRLRAELARATFELGHHAEVYADLAELADHRATRGIAVIRDRAEWGGVEGILDTLSAACIWLPLVAMDSDPDAGQVVRAVKAGAIDYLALPLDRRRLGTLLSDIDEEARAHAEARRRVIDARTRIGTLTPREREVLDWLSLGSSNKAIARELAISPRTVEIHRANMMTKLGAVHAAEAVRLRIEAQLEAPSVLAG